MTPCPKCNAKLVPGKTRRIGSLIRRYRNCSACDYRDRAYFKPEELVRTEPVQARTNTSRKQA